MVCTKIVFLNCSIGDPTTYPRTHSLNFSDVIRGCASQLNEQQYDTCGMGNSTCKLCHGDQCNMRSAFQRCRVCNSEKDGPNCVRYGYAMRSKTCTSYDDECYVHVHDDIVIRGCVGEQTIDTDAMKFREKCKPDSDLCEICKDDNCNRKMIDGEFCLVCDSSNDPDCRLNPNSTMHKQCPLAMSPMGCYRKNNISFLIF